MLYVNRPFHILIWEGFIMKIKTILKSLFLSWLLTGICLLMLAFLVFRFNMGSGPVMASVIAVYVIACMAGGFFAGKIIRKDKYRWGLLVGVSYFVLLGAVSFAVQGKWDMTAAHTLTTFCMCLGGGTLGGMLA